MPRVFVTQYFQFDFEECQKRAFTYEGLTTLSPPKPDIESAIIVDDSGVQYSLTQSELRAYEAALKKVRK